MIYPVFFNLFVFDSYAEMQLIFILYWLFIMKMTPEDENNK